MLRDITIPPDIFENVAHCEEWLNAIGSCPVVKRLSFETCFPSITDALASFVAAHPSVTTIAWLFASIASAIPHLRILALIVEIEFELGYLDEFVTAGVVQDALATLTQLDCLFLEIRAIGDLRNVDFDAPSCHFAQKMFKASSIQFLQLKLCSDLQGSGPTQCWQRSSISNGYNASRLDILKVSTDEYNDAERRVLEEN
ncbi:hypothetical protein EVG20_g9609 [Dentipellis fragilis]|uniref:Uncharacterized protein n=1 Tax=Dentipellis fragilis TaxID=205917 RepID=A0A4Y9XZ02_9AGAM|nr:hypothetical protein EVG20_g9609 [Dentipellis fragilis]